MQNFKFALILFFLELSLLMFNGVALVFALIQSVAWVTFALILKKTLDLLGVSNMLLSAVIYFFISVLFYYADLTSYGQLKQGGVWLVYQSKVTPSGWEKILVVSFFNSVVFFAALVLSKFKMSS
jgi:hypothetical protein